MGAMVSLSSSDRLGLSLSGGGLRASLYAFGALLYLVDVGLNRNVRTVSSVSGGSITNGYAAKACRYSEVSPEDFDEVVSSFCGLVRKGVILPRAIVAVIVIVPAVAMVSLIVLSWPVSLPWFIDLGLMVTVLAILLLRGSVLALWFRHVVFCRSFPAALRLGDIDTPVEHVFCATDLNAGAPLDFTTAGNGFAVSGVWGCTPLSDLPVGDAVRASAAFPGGIPPMRLRLGSIEYPREAWQEANEIFRWSGPPPSLYLADGGVWNNLGTDWLTDPGLFGIKYQALSEGMTLGVDYLLVVDAGAPYRRRRLPLLGVPGLGEIMSAFAVANVQYRSTVWPRVQQLREATSRALANQRVPDVLVRNPIVLIRMEEGSWRELVRLQMVDNPTSMKGTGIADPDQVGEVGRRAKSVNDGYLSGYGLPILLQGRRHPIDARVAGEAVYKHRRLAKRTAWNADLQNLKAINSRVSTTLFRLPPRVIFMLLLQGYLDTRDLVYAHFGIDRIDPSIDRLASLAGCTVQVQVLSGDFRLVTVH
jgi:predicted acylesterase/phospholipase RssA